MPRSESPAPAAASPARLHALALVLACAAAMFVSAAVAAAGTLRVCADPNNLPFSNRALAGYENKLADILGSALNETVAYTWHAQRRGFFRDTLDANKCDVVISVPQRLSLVETTRPYYRSGYVFVSRTERHIDLRSIRDPRLHHLTVGVETIGNEGFNTPPEHALAAQGIADNVVRYSVYGNDKKPNPPARVITAVAKGDVDIAAAWGPLAGYFAKHSAVPLTVTPIIDTASFPSLQFQYDIAMGVRKGDGALRAKLDSIVAEKRPQIESLLESYGIPLIPHREQSSLEMKMQPDN